MRAKPFTLNSSLNFRNRFYTTDRRKREVSNIFVGRRYLFDLLLGSDHLVGSDSDKLVRYSKGLLAWRRHSRSYHVDRRLADCRRSRKGDCSIPSSFVIRYELLWVGGWKLGGSGTINNLDRRSSSRFSVIGNV